MWPWWDAGSGECADPEPIINYIYMNNYRGLHGTPATPPTRGPYGHVVNAAISWTGIADEVELQVVGQFFVQPVQVSIGPRRCASPQLLGLQTLCSDSSRQVCRQYATGLRCLVFPSLPLGSHPVAITMGDRPSRVLHQRVGFGTSARLPLYPNPNSDASSFTQYATSEPLAVDVAAPRIVHISSALCDDSHRPPSQPHLVLTDCPNDVPLQVELLVANVDLQLHSSTPSASACASPRRGELGRPSLWTACHGRGKDSYTERVYATGWVPDDSAAAESLLLQEPCEPQLPNYRCRQMLYSIICTVAPQLGGDPRIHFQVNGTSDYVDNSKQLLSDTPASLSFATCQAGYRTQRAAYPQALCAPCDRGYSTGNSSDQHICTACSPGYFAAQVDRRTASRVLSATTPPLRSNGVRRVPVRVLPALPGPVGVHECDSNQYVRLALDSDEARCEPCPEAGVNCPRLPSLSPSGGASNASGESDDSNRVVLVSQRGYYILVQQSSGLASTTRCSPSACVEGAQCVTALQASGGLGAAGTQTVPRTDVAVVNCCGPNRQPASEAAQSSVAVNVLCSACLPGYSEVQGSCVWCPSTRWDRLLGVLLVAFLAGGGAALAVRERSAVHVGRAAHLRVLRADVGRVPVRQSLPLFVSFLNLDLLGSGEAGANAAEQAPLVSLSFCIVPLSGYGKIAMAPAVSARGAGLPGAASPCAAAGSNDCARRCRTSLKSQSTRSVSSFTDRGTLARSASCLCGCNNHPLSLPLTRRAMGR